MTTSSSPPLSSHPSFFVSAPFSPFAAPLSPHMPAPLQDTALYVSFLPVRSLVEVFFGPHIKVFANSQYEKINK